VIVFIADKLSLRRASMKIFCLMCLMFSVKSCVDNELPKVKDTVVLKTYNREELSAYFHKCGIDTAHIAYAIEIKAFIPAETMEEEVRLLPYLTFDWLDLDNFDQSDPFRSIWSMTSQLYRLFPDAFVVPSEEYEYDSKDLTSIISLLKTGEWTPLCADISRIGARIIEEKSGGFVNAGIINLDLVGHVLNKIDFFQNEDHYILALDIQNGKIGPVYAADSTLIRMDELKAKFERDDIDDLILLSLPDDVVHQRRNLYYDYVPVNLFPDSLATYHRAYPESGYQVERLTYSVHDYLWFQLGTMDEKLLMHELIEKLLASE